MDFSLSSSLVGSAVSNPDKLALDLQFATDKTLTARKGPTPVFTRASSGTFVGSNGLIQSAGNNVARFDHDPVSLACKGLLIEESRTNACFNSNLLTSASWIPTNLTVATDAAGPDGATAYEVSETINTSNHLIGNSGGATSTLATSVVSGTNYTGSMFFKKVVGSIDWIQLALGSSGFGTVQYANFNIGNGTIGNSAGLASGTSPQIQDYGNGWYRCSITVTAIGSMSTTANTVVFFTNNTDVVARSPIYPGNTANKVIIAMGQFETGTFATSYIPTTTASVIRSADVCSISGSDFSGFYNPLEGSLLANAFTPASGDRTVLTTDDNTSNEMIRLRTEGTNPFLRVIDGGSEVVAIDAGTVTANTVFKLIGAYKVNDFASSINGGSAVTDATGTIPTVDRMRIGAGQGGNTMCGCVSAIRYFKKRLPNAKLQALTV